jgi:hypothetical protein
LDERIEKKITDPRLLGRNQGAARVDGHLVDGTGPPESKAVDPLLGNPRETETEYPVFGWLGAAGRAG